MGMGSSEPNVRKTSSQTHCLQEERSRVGGGESVKLILQAFPSLDLLSFDVLRCSQGLRGLFELSSQPPASPIGCHFLFKKLFLQLLCSAQGAEAFEIAAASVHSLLE